MAKCISCQQRAEAIAKIAHALGGTIVFGAKRVMAAVKKPQPEKKDG